ncbi:sodium:proton exchanger [Curtobacterium sp. MCBD17_028]|nr:sodium:proton exchanger [Curtobacterium sp. MCBD17_028]
MGVPSSSTRAGVGPHVPTLLLRPGTVRDRGPPSARLSPDHGPPWSPHPAGARARSTVNERSREVCREDWSAIRRPTLPRRSHVTRPTSRALPVSADDAFTLAVGLAGLAAVAAVVSSRLSTLIRVPSPALFLIAAVAASSFFPVLETVPRVLDEHVVSVALVFILFDGGMHIGWSRFRNSLGPITWLGVAGTAVTAAGVALAGHLLLELPWQQSLLLGAALAPTDPAVVFSVLGKREISGRSGTILEGESGANDPVGIALMVSLLAATGAGLDAVTQGLLTFVLQLLIGTAVGVLGGLTLRWALQRLALPNEALHSIWTLAFAVVLYAVGTLLHGSGFLAVFLAGILIGDVRAPFKREIDRFSSGFSNLAEIVVFTLLGLSTDVAAVVRPDVLLPGLLIAALLILVVRPLFVGALTIPLRLRWGERAFVLWAGLKGAVPILLGLSILASGVAHADRLFGIIFVVVVCSVVLQGGLVPFFARRFHIPMRVREPEPFAVGMRLTAEPEGLHRHVVQHGSEADGRRVDELLDGEDGWISVVRRQGRLIRLRRDTVLHEGDEVLALADDEGGLDRLFDAP